MKITTELNPAFLQELTPDQRAIFDDLPVTDSLATPVEEILKRMGFQVKISSTIDYFLITSGKTVSLSAQDYQVDGLRPLTQKATATFIVEQLFPGLALSSQLYTDDRKIIDRLANQLLLPDQTSLKILYQAYRRDLFDGSREYIDKEIVIAKLAALFAVKTEMIARALSAN